MNFKPKTTGLHFATRHCYEDIIAEATSAKDDTAVEDAQLILTLGDAVVERENEISRLERELMRYEAKHGELD